MTIEMGKYLRSDFSGPVSGTPWKNASIKLVNCGLFNGYYNGGDVSSEYRAGGIISSPLNNNILTLTLTPTAGIMDAANGVMNVDNVTGKATGIGIQLSTSANTAGKINLNTKVTQNLVKGGSSNITVPLYARYIQTSSSVTPGVANGKLEYTITYQ